ncbi:hypothetical protein D3C80_2065970 [compost metagenome]
MLFVSDHPTLFVLEGVRQTARLGAIAAVGAATGVGVGNIALPGKRHAQRTVDEELDGRVGLVGNRTDLLQVQLTGQHQL